VYVDGLEQTHVVTDKMHIIIKNTATLKLTAPQFKVNKKYSIDVHK